MNNAAVILPAAALADSVLHLDVGAAANACVVHDSWGICKKQTRIYATSTIHAAISFSSYAPYFSSFKDNLLIHVARMHRPAIARKQTPPNSDSDSAWTGLQDRNAVTLALAYLMAVLYLMQLVIGIYAGFRMYWMQKVRKVVPWSASVSMKSCVVTQIDMHTPYLRNHWCRFLQHQYYLFEYVMNQRRRNDVYRMEGQRDRLSSSGGGIGRGR
eukprot:358859-Chlamydomonas_euryale.AAC.12